VLGRETEAFLMITCIQQSGNDRGLKQIGKRIDFINSEEPLPITRCLYLQTK
jgi:hypothetical protein